MELSLSRVPSALTHQARHHSLLQWMANDRMTFVSGAALILWLVATALACLGLGLWMILESNSIVEVKVRYDNGVCSGATTCVLNVTIPEQMRPPIFFYYQLDSFQQNTRRYVKSRSDAQLQGDANLSISDVDYCDPTIVDASNLVYYPCGLIAFTFFNDQFRLSRNGKEFTGDNWKSSGITWPTDPGNKFVGGKFNPSNETKTIARDGMDLTLPSIDDEDFMVWMRPAALPKFRKLYRIINSATLDAHETLSLTITNLFVGEDNANKKTKKYIVLSNRSWLGSKNATLGIIYVVLATIFALIAGALFFTLKFIPPKTTTTEIRKKNKWRIT